MTFELFPHQAEAIIKMEEMEKNEGKGGILADEMGLGKTVTIIAYLKAHKIHRHTDLIVCPLSLLTHWVKEIARVYGKKTMPRILIYHGKKRKKKMKGEWDIVITTYGILGTRELTKYHWGRVVLDEAHYIKNGLKRRAPKCASGAYRLHAQYKWCVTGTPLNNHMKDIIALCKFIGTVPYNNPQWWKLKNGGKDEEEVRMWKEKYLIRRTKDSLLPPPIIHNVEVKPTKNERVLIKALRDEAKEKFSLWKRASGLEKITLQGKILGLIMKLRLISDSYYVGETNLESKKILKENSKVRAILKALKVQIVRDPTNGVVIFSQFTSFLTVLKHVISEAMPDTKIYKFVGSMSQKKRDKVVRKFTKSTEKRVLLISLMAGGVGLNLKPCASVFLCEPWYNPFVEKQAEERVHRLGQQHKVEVYKFSMKNSVETWMEGVKARKLSLASELGLVSKSTKFKDFSFDDLKDLFSVCVDFSKKRKQKAKHSPRREGETLKEYSERIS